MEIRGGEVRVGMSLEGCKFRVDVLSVAFGCEENLQQDLLHDFECKQADESL